MPEIRARMLASICVGINTWRCVAKHVNATFPSALTSSRPMRWSMKPQLLPRQNSERPLRRRTMGFKSQYPLLIPCGAAAQIHRNERDRSTDKQKNLEEDIAGLSLEAGLRAAVGAPARGRTTPRLSLRSIGAASVDLVNCLCQSRSQRSDSIDERD